MDSFISLDITFKVNNNLQVDKLVLLITIFYDYFDNNKLVERAKKNVKVIEAYSNKREGKIKTSEYRSLKISFWLHLLMKYS